MKTRTKTSKCLIALSALLFAFCSITWGAAQTSNDSDSKTTSSSASNNADSDVVKRINNSATVLNEIMATPDKGIPDNIFAEARCVAVIPSMIKIAIGFGGSHGKGVATCRTPNGWSAPAPITITGGSWGLQLGGQAVDLVLLVMNQKGMDNLLSSKFKIGAGASASAGPVGRHAEAGTDWKMKSEVLSYSRSRGVFAGVDLNGSAITQDKDETRILYGKMVPFTDILGGKVAAPAGSHEFLATVRKYATEAKENKQSGSLNTPSETTPSK
jgi:lipid-binding SYLF domain-containing protein